MADPATHDWMNMQPTPPCGPATIGFGCLKIAQNQRRKRFHLPFRPARTHRSGDNPRQRNPPGCHIFLRQEYAVINPLSHPTPAQGRVCGIDLLSFSQQSPESCPALPDLGPGNPPDFAASPAPKSPAGLAPRWMLGNHHDIAGNNPVLHANA